MNRDDRSANSADSEEPKPTSAKQGNRKRRKGGGTAVKYKKAPGAPTRFRSAFILFSQAKHKEFRERLIAEQPDEEVGSKQKVS